jgi:hypothetical protein
MKSGRELWLELERDREFGANQKVVDRILLKNRGLVLLLIFVALMARRRRRVPIPPLKGALLEARRRAAMTGVGGRTETSGRPAI